MSFLSPVPAAICSNNEEQMSIRTELLSLRPTTWTDISAIRADRQALQETQSAQGIEQAVLSAVGPLSYPHYSSTH